MSNPDYKHPIALGPLWTQAAGLDDISGVENLTIVGRSDTADAGTTFFDIRPEAEDLSYLNSAEQLNIVSTNVADTNGGTGAQAILIVGLDNNWDPIQEIVVMNGDTNVLTTQAFLRVNLMTVATAGSAEFNVGTITATSAVTVLEQCEILPNLNTSTQSNYSVAAGSTLLINNIIFSVGKADEAELVFSARNNTLPTPVWTRGPAMYVSEATGEIVDIHLSVGEKTDIKIIARAISNNPRILVTTIATKIN